VIRSAIDYAKSFMHCVSDTRSRGLLKEHFRPFGKVIDVEPKVALKAAVEYLVRAQQQHADAGMGSYHLVHGWGASYPETTGYAIPSLMASAKFLEWPASEEAAIKAAEWLLTIQQPDGGWQGGRVGEGRPSIVFNTAQVMRGMLAVHAHTSDERFLEAARKAALWIESVQDPDGAWRASNFLGVARVYDTYVDAPLLLVHAITGDARLKEAAERNLRWVLEQQQVNGWFANCDNTVRHNDRPITHTIAYTIDGLLECEHLLRQTDLGVSAAKASRELLRQFLANGTLCGRYNAQWKGSESPLMTGCAQLVITWSTLFERTGEEPFRDGAIKMTEGLKTVQHASLVGPLEQRGAMPGSYPLWGRYEKFAFPNWATKYYIDALLAVERIKK